MSITGIHACMEFKLADLWVGVFWRDRRIGRYTELGKALHVTDLWICLVPTLPLHVTVSWLKQEVAK